MTTDQHVVDEERRQMLSATPLMLAAGLLWKPQPVAAQEGEGRGARLVLDVACLGHTFAPNFTGALNQAGGDLRGASFYVEGALYPAGTIPTGSGFNPAGAPSVGHWLCRGWFMLYPARPEPAVITTQEYLLGVIDSSKAPSPADTLVSSGVENTGVPGARVAMRAIIGGSGRYRHAGGEVAQETIGTNTTVLNVFGFPAPNFRFHFRF